MAKSTGYDDFDKTLEHLPNFTTRDDKFLYYVKMLKNNMIFAWECELSYGIHSHFPRRLKLSDVTIDTLKEIEVWDKLSNKVKSELEQYEKDEKNHLHTHMDKLRQKRKQKYEGVPRELVCCKCGKKQKMAPAIIVQRADKEVRSIENWVKEWQCNTCKPSKRGRQPDPAYANLPKELVCKCGNKVNTSPYAIVARAKKLGITPEEVVKGYKCQTCCATKGRHKRMTKKKS